ncbi:hypothetical protein K435DRAFT_881391 [Dendrothele bispora CBS 962.96]|uniref:Uncharacterized protein n=1 Tax=Dendrothele bispora (strain CBS 962.96) TaxID=1314807 RepID=A0A4S8KIF7_DENBC|nr:hypothetical protein K435DRAFT_881391 [Dendrothele bispora CBS 962.96]
MSRTQTGAIRTSTKAGGAKPTKDQVPRPSASLVIINDKDEVLMVQRTMQASASFLAVTTTSNRIRP